MSIQAAVDRLENTPATVAVVIQELLPAEAVELRETFPDVAWLSAGARASRARALNLGLATVLPDCRLVLLCSGDIVVQPDALRCMVAFLRRHPDIDGCVGGLFDAAGSPLPIRTRFDSLFRPRLNRPHKATLPGTT